MSEESKMPTKDNSNINIPTKDNSNIKMPTKVGMDEANKTALNIMNEQGPTAFVSHVFKDQETGRQLSYSEMRSRYG